MEPSAHPSDQQNNRRATPRARVLKGVRIVFNNGSSSFSCTLRNLSSGGAMLQFGDTTGIPAHFDLEIGVANSRRTCTVRWRNRNAVGVSFDPLH